MSSRSTTYIRDRRSGELMEATLIDGVSKEEIEATEQTWRPMFKTAPPNSSRQHAHWDWKKKYVAVGNLLIYQIMGIERDGQLQGLILIQTGQVFCRIPTQIGKGLVYILFLETAPWNLPVVVTNPRYGQIGTVLIAEAISISLDLGFSGRIGLHSLPQTEEWYAKYCGMTDLGHDPDPKHQNLRYFEMTPVQAANFLSN